MPAFTHREGVVHWDGQRIDPPQAIALAAEFKDFADAAFFAADFPAFERAVDTRDELIAAIQAANRWAAAAA